MKTITLTFNKEVKTGADGFNNPVYEIKPIVVPGCLIAPITEPLSYREEEALSQSREQVRIHLPKSFDGDVSHSSIEWNGKIFRVDDDSVQFMNENCPTQWNRYFRAEVYDE